MFTLKIQNFKKCIFVALTVFVFSSYFSQTTYFWHGTTSSDWATASNWSTNTSTPSVGSAVPASTDNVVIITRTRQPILDQERTVNNFTLTSGILDLNTFMITIDGTATFTAGAVNNGTILKTSTGTVVFGNSSGGPTIGANIDLKAGTLTLRNTTFNGTTILEKTGTSNDASTGNNTFNGITSITKSGTSGTFTLQNTTRDIFNNDVSFTNSGTASINIAMNSDASGSTQFNGNLTLNVLNTGGITFGQGSVVTSGITGGTTLLASGKTLSTGTWTSTGALIIRNFTQLGTATTHTLNLAGTTNLLNLQRDNTWNGTVNFKAPQLSLASNTFNGTTTLEKSGASTNASTGNNVFNGLTTIIKSGTGALNLSNVTRDIFNGDLIVSNLASAAIQLATNSDISGATQFNGNVYLNNTSSGGITFGQGTTVTDGITGGTSILASGKVITIGDLAWTSTGSLTIRNFTQLGTGTTHNLSLTGTTNFLNLQQNNTWNGTIIFKAPQFALTSNTFNGITTLEKTGASANSSAGNNVFNNSTTLINSGTNSFIFSNVTRDIFNDDVTLTSSGTGILYLAQNDDANGSTYFNGNVYLNVSGTGGIRFGQGSIVTGANTGGSSILADGKLITTGTIGFTSTGALFFRNFTQLGTTPQTLNAINNSITMNGNNTWNADLSLATRQFSASVQNSFLGDFSLQIVATSTSNSTVTGIITYGGQVAITNSANSSINLQYGTTFSNLVTYINEGNGRININGGNTYQSDVRFKNLFSNLINTNPNSGIDIYNGKCIFLAGNGGIWLNNGATAISYFNDDIELNGTSTNYRVSIGGGTVFLADGKTIKIGADGFSGDIRFNNLTQLGTTPLIWPVADNATINFSGNTTINAPISFWGGRLSFTTSTVNNTITAELRGTSTTGINFGDDTNFNGDVNLTVVGSAEYRNYDGCTFNANLTLTVLNGSFIFNRLNGLPSTTYFNENIVLNSADSSRGIFLSDTTTITKIQLAEGKTISIGSLGFSAGELRIQNLIQNGSTPQVLGLTDSSRLTLLDSNVWNGPVDFSAPILSARGNTFNNIASLETSGDSTTHWDGGNIYNAATTIKNSGSGDAYIGDSLGDTFNGDVTFVRTGSGVLYPAYNTNTSFTKNVSVAGSTSPVQFAMGANGLATFNGTITQELNNGASDPSPEFKKLKLLNNAGLNLNTSTIVTDSLLMNGGDFTLANTKMIEIGTSASQTGAISWNTGTIIGPLKRWFASSTNASVESGIFPIGKVGLNRYAQVNFTSAPSTGGYIIAQFVEGLPTDNYASLPLQYTESSSKYYVQNSDQVGYWDITPYSASGVKYGALDDVAYTLKLRINNPTSVENGGILANPPQVRLIRAKGNPDGSHDDWSLAGIHTSISAITEGEDYLVTSSSVVGFSWFNGGGNNANPLPVELLNFNAEKNNRAVDLYWQTASEHNNDYFTVERTFDGEHFEIVGMVDGAGNSNQLLSYSLFDENPANGYNYYRLKQTDFDGTSKYSDLRSVYFGPEAWVNVYPNPSNGLLNIVATGEVSNLAIYAADGKLVQAGDVNGLITLFLEPGMYFVNFEANGKNNAVKVVVAN